MKREDSKSQCDMKIDQWAPSGVTKDANKLITNPKSPIPKKKHKCVVFHTGGGGLGKIIQSTAVLREIRKAYGTKADIHVITPHVSVFQGNPEVHKCWSVAAQAGFYELILKTYGADKITWLQYEPYHDRGYIDGTKHIVKAWCAGLDLETPDRMDIKPELHINAAELKEATKILRPLALPIIVFQISGGGVSYTKEGKAIIPKMFNRNVNPEIMQSVIAEMQEDYAFLQIAKNGQPLLAGCQHLVDVDTRLLFAVISVCDMVVCIDSFAQHAAAALGKKAIVLWASTNPATLGYDMHNNMYRIACPTPLCGRPNSFLGDTNPDNSPWSCPHGTPCSDHDVGNIISAIEEY
jgi:hypothetical protein